MECKSILNSRTQSHCKRSLWVQFIKSFIKFQLSSNLVITSMHFYVDFLITVLSLSPCYIKQGDFSLSPKPSWLSFLLEFTGKAFCFYFFSLFFSFPMLFFPLELQIIILSSVFSSSSVCFMPVPLPEGQQVGVNYL